jgi:RNA polymerase sigma-70 factor (ECF subfamily)
MSARLVEIESVYRSRYRSFLRVARAIVGDDDVARDAVHDGFVRAVVHRQRWRGEAPLEVWIWRIVVNEARKRGRRLDPRPLPYASIEDTPSENGVGEPIRSLLVALPERQRLTLFLRYYADLDYQSIADALGVSVGTVGATLNTAHSTLRKHLQEAQT